MVCINKDDVATTEKSRKLTFHLKYKRRKVSAKRDFPQNCGRNIPRIGPLLPQDGADGDFPVDSRNTSHRKKCGIVSAVRDFPKNCGRHALSMNAKLEKKAAVSGDSTFFVGCQQNASQTSAKSSKDGASDPIVEKVDVDTYAVFLDSDGLSAESLSVKQSGNSMEHGNYEMTERPDKLGSPLPKAFTPESTDALDVLHQLDTTKVIEASEPIVTGNQTSTAKTIFMSPSRELEYTGLLKSSDGSNTVDFLKGTSKIEGKDLPHSLMQLPVDSVSPGAQVQSKISDQVQASSSDEAVENNSHKKYPPCRRVSACPQCFPSRSPCSTVEVNSFKNDEVGNEMASGQNIGDQNVSSDETQNNVKIKNEHSVDRGLQGCTVMNKEIVDDTEVKLLAAVGKQAKAFESNLNQKIMDETSIQSPCVNLISQSDINYTSNIVIDRDVEVSEENLEKESPQLKENICLKRKFPEKHVYESCVGNDEVELYNRRIVQVLMAAPSCPWSIQKGRSKSQSSTSDPTVECKGKKPADVNFTVNCSQEKEHAGLELSKKRVFVLALMAAPNCPWNMCKMTSVSPSGFNHEIADGKEEMLDLLLQDKPNPVSERENAMVERSKIKYTRKKLFRTRHDEEDGNTSIQTSHKDLSLIPFGLHPLDDECDNNETDVIPNDGNGSLPSVQISDKMESSVIPCGLHPLDYRDNSSEGVSRNRVREILRLFNGIVRKLTQDAESKSKDVKSNNSGRVDLAASKILKKKQKWVNTVKILGSVPGVEVGDEFRFRVELAIIGLHRLFQGGIDYLKKNGKIVAISIVASGRYADVMDSSDVLVYSGQGGIPPSGKKIAEDQQLVRGNLALKNSIDEETPVRVIRGFREIQGNEFPDSKNKVVATYTYDGLYLVEKYWEEKGSYGTNVFKFQLRRIPGQPELPLREVKKSKKGRVREGLCIDDISQGKEKRPICAINTVDTEKPPAFEYITHIMYPSWYIPLPSDGCGCTDGCSDSETCLCAVKNGGEIPYNHNGAIVEAKTLVYECGPSCKCPSTCHNRVSQRGIKIQLEIFKTESRGWGVRSLNSIPSGSFICEYTGELLQDKEAEQRTGNDEYLFDIGHNYKDNAVSEGVTDMIQLDSKSSIPSEAIEEDEGFTIDAAMYGSVGRFVNHSCSPNLYAQNVLYDHNDTRMPHIMLFAAENIPPLQELTYHYNYELGQVRDSEGNIKKKDCYCGSLECTGRMY